MIESAKCYSIESKQFQRSDISSMVLNTQEKKTDQIATSLLLKCREGDIRISTRYLKGCAYFTNLSSQTCDLTLFPKKIVQAMINTLAGNKSPTKMPLEDNLWHFTLSNYLQHMDLIMDSRSNLEDSFLQDMNNWTNAFHFYIKMKEAFIFFERKNLSRHLLKGIESVLILSKLLPDNNVCIIENEEVSKILLPLFSKIENLDAATQTLMGICCGIGIGTPKDPYKTAQLFHLACQKGYTPAFVQLAMCYALGFGVEKNEDEAIKLSQIALNYRLPHSTFFIGSLYEQGAGLEKNLNKAISFYQSAASLGFAQAQLALGLCHELGKGVKPNAKEASTFYRLAADQGLPYAQYKLAFCYHYGIGVRKEKKRALDLYFSAANKGIAKAQYQLGQFYESGQFVEKNEKLARFYFEKAALQGLVEAKEELELKQNPKLYKAKKLFQKALLCEQDDKIRAFELFQQAAKLELPEAQFKLGLYYEFGIETEKNLEFAIKYYSAAALKGMPDACHQLGLFFEFGRVVKKNEATAIFWFEEAAKNGSLISQEYLKQKKITTTIDF